MEQREMQDIYDQLLEILPQVLAGGNHVIAFWCNAGEHRSVAVREFVHYCLFDGGWLARSLPFRLASDLCRTLWDRRGCGQCCACSTSSLSQVRAFLVVAGAPVVAGLTARGPLGRLDGQRGH